MKLHYFPPAPGTNASVDTSDDSFPTAQVEASGQTFGIVEGAGSNTKINALKLHGWFLWAVWAFMGFFQIASSRYMKTFPRINQWMHMLSGTMTLILTVALSMLGFYWNDWEMTYSIHAILGQTVLFAVGAISIVGFAAFFMMRSQKRGTSRMISVKWIHSVFGYSLIIIS